ncbi:PREDICTED: disease resistance protein TAO1-like [Camelina sativa]|uniref:Disease resistance protein TAO1-like n=1 Tax=Camelina sativa TaxID=90675 RepID=A0ABM1Q8V8_CAMSA|nr:PREDICTED: disease resistance protein TAO1-like [Camelina sativa]
MERSFGGCGHNRRLPFQKGVTNLQKLDLTECSRLVKLSISIGNATNLQILCLNGCSSLVELSFSIGNATNLQELDLRQCSSLVKLPSSIRNATNLQKMYVKGCSSLVEMPFSIGNVILISSNFLTLDREVCSSLVEMPFSIGNVIVNCCLDSWVDFPTRARGYLDFKGYSSLLQIPSFIWNAIELEGLDFSGCSSFVEVSASIGNLHKLDFLVFKGCSKLEVFPVNINLKSLNRLDLSGCSSLKTFPEISTNISYLDLSGTAIDEVPSSIRTWYRLEELILEECKNLFSPTASTILMVTKCGKL